MTGAIGEGGLAMPATARRTRQNAAADQWAIPMIVAAWVVVLLCGFLVLV